MIDPRLLAERSRRVRAILAGASSASELHTFEKLVQESRWTQAAMLSTLLHMKERGEVVEDLNLDTGDRFVDFFDCQTEGGLSSGITAGRYTVTPELVACEGDAECLDPKVIAAAHAL